MDSNLLLAVALALAFSLVYLLLVYFSDANPEPRGVVLTTFILGVLSVIPVIVVAVPALIFLVPVLTVGEGLTANLTRSTGMAFLSAAIPEEFFKWLVVVLYCARHKEFDEPMDGLVYGSIASLGFATLENVVYVSLGEVKAHAGLWLAIIRGFTAVPMHACLGAIMGYFVGQARFATSGKALLYLLSLVVPIFFHGVYDLGAMALPGALNPDTGSPLVALLCAAMVLGSLLAVVIWTLILVWRLRATQFRQAA